MSNRSRPYLTVKNPNRGASVLPWGFQTKQQKGLAQLHADARGAQTKRLNQARYELACAQANEDRRAFHLIEHDKDGSYLNTEPLERARKNYEAAKENHRTTFKH